MRVIIFKGKRKGNDIEIRQALAGFERPQRGLPFKIGLGQKCPFAEDMLIIIQQAVDALKTEIGHPQMITIGIDQGETDAAAPGLSNGSDLGFIRLPGRFFSFQNHGTVRRLLPVLC